MKLTIVGVGEKVCELSGLSEVLSEKILDEELAAEEKLKADEEAYIIDGDKDTPEISLGQLQEDANNHYTA